MPETVPHTNAEDSAETDHTPDKFLQTGDGIISAWIGSSTATLVASGTSVASPHVAGVAVLYLEHHQNASPYTVGNAIISNATTGVLTEIHNSPNRLLHSVFSQGEGSNDALA
jgi:subtilisin family serine protease